jgi:hypothetical protein
MKDDVPDSGPRSSCAEKAVAEPMPETIPSTVRWSGLLALKTANLMLEEPALRTRIWLDMAEFPGKILFLQWAM